jgi:hypothetical protein
MHKSVFFILLFHCVITIKLTILDSNLWFTGYLAG